MKWNLVREFTLLNSVLPEALDVLPEALDILTRAGERVTIK